MGVNQNTDVREERDPSMRRSIDVLLMAVVAAVGLQPTPAAGQSIPSAYTYLDKKQEAGPFVGYMSAATGRFGYGPSGGTVFGGRWGVDLSGPLSFEGVAGIVSGTRDVINPGRVAGDWYEGEADALLTMIDARLKFSFVGARAWHGFSPFIVAGGGMAIDASGESELDTRLEAADRFDFGSSFFGTLGFGTRWFVSDSFALRADGVFSLWKLDTPPGFSSAERGLDKVEESEWARGLTITVSALLRW